MIILAIDPGTTGSAAVLEVIEGRIELVSVLAFGLKRNKHTWEEQLRNILWVYRPNRVVVENVHAMPGDGKKGAFTFGGNKRAIDVVLKLEGYRSIKVAPQVWQRRVGCPHNYHILGKEARRTQGRKDQKEIALKLFPGLSGVQGDVFASVLIGYAEALDVMQVPRGGMCSTLP